MDLIRKLRDYAYGVWIMRRLVRFHADGGKVIMITGSYGKTSVRELCYDLLRQKYPTLQTSRNYNTAVGIAKTLRWELSPKTRIIVVEVGAYHVGEITRFANWLKPDIGVITGIARQHLERFGSWENIITAKTELARYMQQSGGILIANGSDETVRENVAEAIWYKGGERNEVNLRAAQEIAKSCGMTNAEIKVAIKKVRAIPSRFEITTDRYGMRVIDNSYNSNEKSMTSALEYLGKQQRYYRIVVTPGLLELGSESSAIHEQIGRVIRDNTDLAILVGKNKRTESLARGIGKEVATIWIEKTLDFMTVLKARKLEKEPLVLIENDIPSQLLN